MAAGNASEVRIPPLDPPYPPEIATGLERWMPPAAGVETLTLFRTLYRHPDLASRMRPLGAGILGHGQLAPRDRELMIHRTSARTGARYEWGVHAAFFAAQADLTDEQLRSTAVGGPDDPCWSEHDARILRLADELHDSSAISSELFDALAEDLSDAQLIELVVCAGFYHAIAYVLALAGTEPEPWAVPFPG